MGANSMNLKNHYIAMQFRKLDFTDTEKVGTLKVRGAVEGETNWLNINYNQLSTIRAVLLLNADDLDKLLTHMQWEYPECPSTWEHHKVVNGADTKC
jgi:hypothetical protein